MYRGHVNAAGGFYNEGTTGPVKLTKQIALSTTMLAWSMLDAPDVYIKDPSFQVPSENCHRWDLLYFRALFAQLSKYASVSALVCAHSLAGFDKLKACDVVVQAACTGSIRRKKQHALHACRTRVRPE
jgi:hypothetical protein